MKRLFVILLILVSALSCGGRSGSPSRGRAGQAGAAQSAERQDSRSRQPRQYTYRVVEVLPHDPGAYTQGLFWHDGHLYEGTGQYGRSGIRRVEPSTGKVLQSVPLDRIYFGEGITLLDGRIYQLTWSEGRAFIYDASDLRQLRTFSYDGEGWGLTTDGERLYMSDGTDAIYVRDPATFAVERTIRVTANRRPVHYINELEWIEGELWANLYTTDQIIRIDPATGNVTGVIDFYGLHPASERTPDTDVFNGIAYDPATGHIYVTGKNWNRLYRVEIVEKQTR